MEKDIDENYEYRRLDPADFEGVYTPEEVALNGRLYEACRKAEPDVAWIEELLKQGADPLGPIAESGWDVLDHIYGELVMDSLFDDDIDLPQITELFLKHGMDVASPRIPYDNDNSLHVLRYLPEKESSLPTLKILLDHGVDADAVGEFWGRFIFGELNYYHEDPNDEEWHDRFVYAMKMIMLIASYDHIIDNDEYLRELICCQHNRYDLHKFRAWDGYEYVFDTSRCDRHPQLHRCVIRIYEKENGTEVWRIGVSLRPEEYM